MLTEWEIPTDPEHAEERRRILVAEIQEIQTQLGDRNRERNQEYWRWRQNSKWAMTKRLQELRLVKDWLRENRPTV
jgi:hypothetical protein